MVEIIQIDIIQQVPIIEVELGPIGPPGVPGGEFTVTAGASIMAFQCVVCIGGLLYPADPTNAAHITQVVGVATTSATIGNPVNARVMGQVVGFPSNLTPGAQYSVGLSGILSTSPTAVGAVWRKVMGVALSSTTLLLCAEDTIEIA